MPLLVVFTTILVFGPVVTIGILMLEGMQSRVDSLKKRQN